MDPKAVNKQTMGYHFDVYEAEQLIKVRKEIAEEDLAKAIYKNLMHRLNVKM